MKKIGIILLICIIALLAFYNPQQCNFFPPCPFRYLTGLQCPGCGAQRAVHQILNGNISQAFALNPLLVLSIPYLLLGLLLEHSQLSHSKLKKIREKFYHGKVVYFIAAIIILFAIIRNII